MTDGQRNINIGSLIQRHLYICTDQTKGQMTGFTGKELIIQYQFTIPYDRGNWHSVSQKITA